MSKPVNQMDTIQEILNSVKPMKDALTPDGFGRVFNDQAAKNATGFRGATLENTLEQNQLQALEALKDDLKRRMFASSAGRGVGLDTAQKLAYSNMVRQAGFPSWLTGMKPAQGIGNIAARVTDIGYKGANEQMSRDLAEAILEPNKFIGLLEAAAPNQKEDLVKQFISRGGAGAGMMIPGLLNGGK
jgi:hypothetical protein